MKRFFEGTECSKADALLAATQHPAQLLGEYIIWYISVSVLNYTHTNSLNAHHVWVGFSGARGAQAINQVRGSKLLPLTLPPKQFDHVN